MGQSVPLTDLLNALGYLPEGSEVTITVSVADLRNALTNHSRGPEIMTAEQAAQHFGYTAERWRRWAKANRIEGAYQESAGGPWHLPKVGVEAHLRRQQRKAPATSAVVMQFPTPRGIPRGPRKKAPPASA